MADLDPTLVRLEAERLVQRALDHIERAERELDAACQALSPVIGALPDWQRIGKLSLKVHAMWQRLHEVKPRGGYRLDESGLAALARRLPGGEGAAR
jgi:hypothetical protein